MHSRLTLLAWLCGLALVSCDTGAPSPPPPPSVAGRLYAYQQWDSTPPGSAAYGPGDTIRFQFEVHASRAVEWLGYIISGTATQRDSFAVPEPLDTAVSALVKLVFPTGTRGLSTIRVFAHDTVGGYGEAALAGNPLSLYDTVTYPVTASAYASSVCGVIIPVHVTPFVGCDVVPDAKRNVVYLSEPDSVRIAVLSLATMTYGPPITAPGIVSGLDLTLDGDSLVVALPTLNQLGIVDLTTPTPTWHLVDLTLNTHPGRRPAGVRVAATNRVLISLSQPNLFQSPPPPLDSLQLIEYDLGTGVQRARFDIAPGAGLSIFRPLARSADARRLLLATEGFFQAYQLYQAEHDRILPAGSFSITGNNTSGEIPAISLSATGHRFLIKGFLFDDMSRQVAYLDPPGDGWISALSPGGDTGYFGLGASLLRTRLADGATFERVLLPEVPTRIDLLPGGAQILVRGGERIDFTRRVYLVHLGGTPLASARARAARSISGAIWSSAVMTRAAPP